MRSYSFEEFNKDVRILAKDVRDSFAPDAIVAVSRGGLTIGHALAFALGMRTIFTINSIHYDDTCKLDTIEVFNIPELTGFKKVLLVDDIVDSGESTVEIRRVLLEKYPDIDLKIAVIFYKERALIKPEYKIQKTDEWIEFFWETYVIED